MCYRYRKLGNVNIGDLTDSQYADLMEQIAQTEDAKGLYDAIGKDIGYISDATKLCKTVADIVKTVSMYSTLNETSKATEAVLKTICDNCPTDNAAMLSASKKVYEYITGALTENMIIMMEGGEAVFSTAFDEIVGKLWSAALTTALGSFGTGVLIGQAVGKAISNFAFSTDATIDKYYAMNALVQFEDVIVSSVLDLSECYKNNETAENADNYLHSIELMLATYNLGCDYTNDFAEIVFEKGFVNSVKNMFGKSQTLTNMQSSITSMKCSIEFAYGLVSIDTYKYYLNEDAPALYDAIYGNNVSEEIPIRELQITQKADLAIGDEGPTYDFFSVKYLPQDNTEHVFGETVTSSDENVITVDNSSCIGGYLTAVGEGTCTLTFTSYNGKNFASIEVTVENGSSSGNLDDYSDWKYIINEYSDTIKITQYLGDDTEVYIPSTIDGHKVVELGYNTHNNHGRRETYNGPLICGVFEDNKTIQTIHIPDSIEIIGNYTFCGCSALKEVQIPYGVTNLEYGCFYGCSSLQNITIPDSVCSIGERAFNFTSIESIEIPDSVCWLGEGCFYYCTQLKKAVIGSGVTALPFYDPGSYNNAGELYWYEGTFENCISLETLELKGKNIVVNYKAFYNCEKLQNLDIHVSQIQALAFSGCNSLKTVRINSDKKLSFNNSYPKKYYGDYSNVFDGSSIETLYLPHKFYSINYGAFSGCKDTLKDLYYNGSEATWKSINQDTLPETVTVHFCNHDNKNILKVIEPSCTEEGYTLYECVSCSEEVSQDIIPAQGHNYVSTVTEPTCTEQGYTTCICSACGEQYICDYVPATGHNYVDNMCVKCGKTHDVYDVNIGNTYDIDIDLAGDKYYLYFIPKNDINCIFYSTGNYDTYVTLYDENMNRLRSNDDSGSGRNFSLYYEFKAGNTYLFECRMYSSSATGSFQVTLEQHEHSYSSTVIEPTCTASGYTQYSCSCGSSYTSDYVLPTGHNYVNDICTVCGKIRCDFEYELLADGTISITKYTGTEIDVIVPSSIGEYIVKEISSGAFDDLDFLESITFSEGIESVYCNCLNCTNLETVNIPSTVNYLSEYSFTNETINEFVDDNQNYTVEENSGSLKAINISSENPYYCSLDGVVFSKNMEELIKYPAGKENTIYEIPNSVKSFSSLAFIFCGNINKLVIPASVESIENEIFGLFKHIKMDGYQNIIEFDSVFQEFEVSADNANYCSVDGVLYTKNMDTLVAYPNGKTEKKFVTDDKVENIGPAAFIYTLVEKVFLSNVHAIEDQAFCQSGFLKNVTLSDNCSYIGNMSFAYCSKLTNIIIPDSATIADEGAFACCFNLEKVVLPSSIEKVSDMMFVYCLNLSEIYIPASITSVEQSAFGTCEKLQTVYFGGTEEEWNNITVGEGNEPLKNATVIFNSSPDIIVNVDSDTLSAAVEKFSEFNSADYSIESYNNLKDIVDRNKEIIDTAQSQQEIDNAVTEILEAIYNLQPYLNLTVTAPNGTFTVAYDGETNSNNSNSLLFGTNVTVSATANEGYRFVGWYDTVNNLYFSKNAEYSFNITTNTSLTAVFVEEQSATLTFTTYSNWVQSTVTKTIDEWNAVESIDELLPVVPYRYGYSNGRWVYDNAEVLAKLQAGENVSLIPEYDKDDTSLPTPPSPDGDTPVLDLYYNFDTGANVGSFVMAAGIPENCQIESVGIAFYYKDAKEFDPTKFELLINNKMLTGRFNTDEIDDIYIINLNNMTARYNFAARGYVTYYNADGILKTVYSNQVNIVNREQV